MTGRDFGTVGVRLLSLFALLQAIRQIDGLVFAKGQIRQINDVFTVGQTLAMPALAVVAPLAVAVLLWFTAERISSMMCAGQQNNDTHARYDLRHLQPMALSIVGVYVLTWAIPLACLSLANHIFFMLNREQGTLTEDLISFWSRTRANAVISSIMQVALGWVLVTKPVQLSRVLERFQARREEQTSSDD